MKIGVTYVSYRTMYNDLICSFPQAIELDVWRQIVQWRTKMANGKTPSPPESTALTVVPTIVEKFQALTERLKDARYDREAAMADAVAKAFDDRIYHHLEQKGIRVIDAIFDA